MSDDWERTTVLRKSRPTTKDARSKTAVNRAMATGNEKVEVIKKYSAGNKQPTSDLNLSKIDQETEVQKVKTVPMEVAKAIQMGRQKAGITQKDLAVRINEKQQVVHDYESGKALPNQTILGKMERALGIKLRGVNVGAPL